MTDLRDALRSLRATPLVSAVAILSLALGLGANSAMFAIVDALILRTLPVQHASRLALLVTEDEGRQITSWTNPIWESIRSRPTLSDGAFAWGTVRLDLSDGGETDPVDVLRASGRMFDVLGVTPVLGRTFGEADDARGGGAEGAVAVISYEFWQRRFAGAADVVGRTLSIERVPFTVIGVTGPEFFGPDVGRTFDIAVPLGTIAMLPGSRTLLDSRDSWWLQVMFRLAPGQTTAQATAAIRQAQAQIASETRPANQRAEDLTQHFAGPLNVIPASAGTSELRDSYQGPVFALSAIVVLTLLIACGNIANLLLSRSNARRHELGVRTALGASRWRLARQLFAESLLLSLVGAALGVAIAFWGSHLVVSQLSTMTDRVFLDVGLDWRVLAFTGAAAVGTALLFGVAPAFRATRIAPLEAMSEAGRSTSSSRQVGLSGSLVIVQVALSLMLLVGAGLFLRTFASLATLDVGFDPRRALVVNVGAQRTPLDSAARAATYARMLEAAKSVQGVSEAALSVTLPVGDNTLIRLMEFPGRPALPESERRVLRNFVGPRFFATLGTPFRAGRDFDERDRLGAPRTVIVNQAFVKKYFAGENPLGRVIAENPDPTSDRTPIEIVGIVGDAIYRSLRAPAPPTMYWPFAQLKRPPSEVKLIVRASTGGPERLTRGIADAITAVNPNMALSFRPLSDQVGASILRERLVAKLSGFFGALALLLAALGLYGITAYAVTQRQLELGIRLALGTSPTGLVRLVLSRTAMLVGTGVAIGLAASWYASTFVESLLFGLPPHDVLTIAGATLILVVVAGTAGWLPARRVARIDPVRVLHRR